MAAALNRKISRRKGLRSQFSKTLQQANDFLSSDNANEAKLISYENSLQNKCLELKRLDEEIQNGIEEENVEKDVEESIEFVEPLHELLANISVKLSEIRLVKNAHETSSLAETTASSSSSKIKCRLPKLEIPPFSGDPLEWQGFWDRFNCSIHENESISDIDKFNYLLRFLSGKALSCVRGLSLSAENYGQALALLKERFGNQQVLISAHMDKLIKIKKVKAIENVEGLRRLYNEVETCLRNLASLKVEVETYGCLLVSILKDKLPDEMLVMISRGFGVSTWCLDKFMEFFNTELLAKENCLSFSSARSESRSSTGVTTAGNLHVQSDSSKSFYCVFCSGDHSSSRCSKVTDVNARLSILKKSQKCFICLSSGHKARQCRSNYACNKCGGRHNISLCLKSNDRFDGESSKSSSSSPTGASCNHVSACNGILLQTASTKVSSSQGSPFTNARLLLDSGSQRSYISEELRVKLGLKTIRQERILVKPFGMSESVVKNLDIVQVFIQVSTERSFCLELICFPHLCDPLTNQNISFALDKFPSLRSLSLADFNHESTDFSIDILIGVDYYHSFFTNKVLRTRGGPTAHETVFGWVLSGKISTDCSSFQSSSLCTTSHVMKCAVESREPVLKSDPLREDLERFWKVESIQGSDNCVIHQFEKDIRFNGERYVTKLPFKPDHPPLPDNLEICKGRLKGMHNRLAKGNLIADYDKVFKDYEEERIIERVPSDEIELEKVHYLPHRSVIREDKETTKLRVVFDASCKSSGPSLNDCLYSGPNLISKIFNILLRFRLNPIAILSDIKQAFLNIEIDKDHQDFLRFLWYNDPFDNSSPLIVYRFLRLVFGLTSSPFILNGTVRHHLKKFMESNGDFVRKFLEDLYVDDSTSGCFSIKEGKEFYECSSSILKSGGFLLRKWVTNSKELQTFFNEREGITSCNGSRLKKVLGVEWDLDSDEFVFSFKDIIDLARALPPTKRNVLKVAATFFDPLGFISPITARVKSIFQLLCKDKSDWDDNVSDDILLIWNSFLRDIEHFNEFRIQRFTFVEISDRYESVTFHGFCDSSETCYAAVLYLQIKTSIGIKVHFIAAKTKVAPLKQLSIARLELSGCLLLSELLSQVKAAVEERISIDKVKCWSDSQVALCWIKGSNKNWKPWVENRVVKIRKVIGCENWFFIYGKDNPADIPTRVCEIGDFERWFKGPSFLFESEDCDESFDMEAKLADADVLVESRKEIKVTTSLVINNPPEDRDVSRIIECTRFGSFDKLINTTAFVLRFVNNLKAKLNNSLTSKSNEIITAEERENALLLWIKAEQNHLRRTSQFDKLKKSLKLFEDKLGVLRLQGRFGSTTLEYDVKHPILVPDGKSQFTVLLVRDCHDKVLHSGVEATLNFLRKRFWIVKGRQTVKHFLARCVVCKRFQGRTLNPPETADLPNFRIDNSFSFCNIGIDYAGPLYVRESPKALAKKVYILLITCASSRAVHLELVHDMKSPSFIRAFERFVARKGTPKFMISDNFRTFKSKEVKRYLAQLGISQKFILPASPWWGGFYERLVRSVKLSLKKSLGRSLITFEQLETVLCKCELVINSRPLTYISSDDLEEPLTPFHLLFGRNVAHPSRNINHTQFIFKSDDASRKMKYLQTLLQHHWKSFSSFYINELRQHHHYIKSRPPSKQPVVGDIVLIRDDLPLPRQRWRLGRITTLVTGRDGLVRGVKLRTSSDNEISRPVQKIIPLEVADCKSIQSNNSRPKRLAAREGQLRRRIMENIVD